eukprot:CAMPEP_0114622306 /NCGR_PEP_ID=MMETSP0168-20121206/9672_1 /TAXON_ID=95228 ORGANISM="Vannella sp., Strain DIVA3 517/6/12" /NCGR_SAMPLE_ID=MMETSP0168 /ASSEMBLY_ACC=CAM_ASM_000044 /LENGTH=207 /DNA_ID=CAMNT_0001833523 /DNA_START=35 /DNA_END=658 /DNA_ORIENTATION=+
MADEREIFPQTAYFKGAIDLMNRMDTSKFPLMLNRIIKTLHLKNESPFTDDEKEQLEGVFELSSAELANALESSAFIFEQAAYFGLKLPPFKAHLEKAGLEQEQIIAFLRVWDVEGANFVAKLRDTSMVPRTMTDVKYQLHLDMAQGSLSRLKDPSAIFELTLRSTEASSEGKEDKPTHVKMQFDHEQLVSFYNNLETIQKQLDQLS